MENAYADDEIESLSLFYEMLGFSPRPKAFKLSHCEIIGDLTKKERVEIVFGTIVIYSYAYNTLMLIDKPVGMFNKEKMEYFKQVF